MEVFPERNRYSKSLTRRASAKIVVVNDFRATEMRKGESIRHERCTICMLRVRKECFDYIIYSMIHEMNNNKKICALISRLNRCEAVSGQTRSITKT